MSACCCGAARSGFSTAGWGIVLKAYCCPGIPLDATDWGTWQEQEAPRLLLASQLAWEGNEYTVKQSWRGAGTKERALRDPYIFEEDGQFYLMYAGGGEEAIAIAKLLLSLSSANI